MTPENIDHFLQSYSLPIVALGLTWYSIYKLSRWFSTKFVDPLGGPDGIIAKFFSTQSEQFTKQTGLMNDLKNIVDKMESNQGGLVKSAATHFKESSEFYHSQGVDLQILIEAHYHIARALAHQFDNPTAIDELKKADAILARFISQVESDRTKRNLGH